MVVPDTEDQAGAAQQAEAAARGGQQAAAEVKAEVKEDEEDFLQAAAFKDATIKGGWPCGVGLCMHAVDQGLHSRPVLVA